MNQDLSAYIAKLPASPEDDRIPVLQKLIDYCRGKSDLGLNFICTHNSRRSQFSQVWAQVAAYHFNIPLKSFSGGVEVTACNPRTVAALERAGLKVNILEDADSNPKYHFSFAEDAQPVLAFSKLYDDEHNPKSGFAAVMTCSHADENCPFIPGTEARIALNYEDPKAFDGTDREAQAYDERCFQIAKEMFYVFKSLRNG